MTKRMLIDSTHAEETRVVVLEGNRLEDYDIETSTKHQLKGNIYLAKVVRVEPSLQAAFVEYGGNRHGFLAFGEIHPDYYQIPIADRKRLIEAQEAEAREDEERAEREAERDSGRGPRHDEVDADEPEDDDEAALAAPPPVTDIHPHETDTQERAAEARAADPLGFDLLGDGPTDDTPLPFRSLIEQPMPSLDESAPIVAADAATYVSPDAAITVAPDEAASLFAPEQAIEGVDMAPELAEASTSPPPPADSPADAPAAALEVDLDRVTAEPVLDEDEHGGEALTGGDAPEPEQIGGEHDTEEHPTRRSTPRFLRNYKIQEVIRRRQILLVQVVKEERGSKGAALTTYISLAGRFSVLMPNSPRGGGISRKITSAADRRRLKEVTTELDLPRGMGLIVRTAGANRPKPEILRDCEYLLNQWDQIRDLTMKSMAPALIYEEANLIKRAIRDVYSRDVDDILIDGEQGWRAAREFMRMLMPTHARKVQLWKDPQPLFAKAQVENQLEAILTPTVQLKSGGYLVINQTEALVAIDVNSGRSTRERGIEETALRTNLEAAEEAARQLRLRDLAGLIVIDFIDMENRRNVAAVERRLKDALRHDRARIQVGNISHFGLLEMSRQRLRPSLVETNYTICAHCGGTGHVRSTESSALHVLRGIEEEGSKRKAAEIVVHCPASMALYILNHKRDRLADIEARCAMRVSFAADELLLPPAYRIERMRPQLAGETPAPIQQLAPPEPFVDPDEIVDSEDGDDDEVETVAAEGETEAEQDQRRRRRRRRRRGGRREDGEASEFETVDADADPAPQASVGARPNGAQENGAQENGVAPSPGDLDSGDFEPIQAADAASDQTGDADGDEPDGAELDAGDPGQDRRRRSRRGGRRRRRDPASSEGVETADAPEQPVEQPLPPAPLAYVGPTPADPFGGANAFDFFDAIEQAEEERALAPSRTVPAAADASPARAPTPEPAPQAAEPPAPAPTNTGQVAAPTEPAEPIGLEPPLAETNPAEQDPAASGPTVGPAVQPVVIGGESASPKRGWWRR